MLCCMPIGVKCECYVVWQLVSNVKIPTLHTHLDTYIEINFKKELCNKES